MFIISLFLIQTPHSEWVSVDRSVSFEKAPLAFPLLLKWLLVIQTNTTTGEEEGRKNQNKTNLNSKQPYASDELWPIRAAEPLLSRGSMLCFIQLTPKA